MTIKEALEYLEYYQYEYRRGDVSIREIDPKTLGKALDIAIEVLRKQPTLTHKQEFFSNVEVPPLIARSPRRMNRLAMSVKFIINNEEDIARMGRKLGHDNVSSFFDVYEWGYPSYIGVTPLGCVKRFPNKKEWLECSYFYLE